MKTRKFVERLGFVNTVIFITGFSLFTSLAISWVVEHFWLAPRGDSVSYMVATIVPLMVAPLASWPVIRLIIKVSQLEKEMRELATYDSLTQLLNRRAFLHDCESFVQYAERDNIPMSLIVMDLDKFKLINDTYGHAGGDAVLQHFSKLLRQIIRKGDLACRLGGEEFALLMPNMVEDAALKFATRLNTEIRNATVAYEQYQIRYTVSIGLISSPALGMDDMNAIIKKADLALYQAKQQGRDRTIVYQAE